MLVPVLVTFFICKRKIKVRFVWDALEVNRMIYQLVKKGFHVIRVEQQTESFDNPQGVTVSDTDDDKQTEWIDKVISKL